MQDIWTLQETLARRLLRWAMASLALAAGIALLLPTPFWQGIAVQCAAWGLIDLAIAWGGLTGTRQRRARLGAEAAAAAAPNEARKLTRILLINLGLDGVYIAAGLGAALGPGRNNPLWLGMGLGIVLQGAFLFGFDGYHAHLSRKLSVKGQTA